MLRTIKRTLLWAGVALAAVALLFGTLIVWPDPLFAFLLGTGKIIVASDRPIPSAGGERFLRDCDGLLERSPLKAKARQYRVYVTNEDWRQRLFFLPHPKAWGVAYSLFGGPAFLSGADFETGQGRAFGICRHSAAHTCMVMRTRTHPCHCWGTRRSGSFSRAAMGMGGLSRLCGYRGPAVVRGIVRRAWRPTGRYPDDDEVWQLSAIPAACDVLHREKGLVC
jgi:hypothetical protein